MESRATKRPVSVLPGLLVFCVPRTGAAKAALSYCDTRATHSPVFVLSNTYMYMYVHMYIQHGSNETSARLLALSHQCGGGGGSSVGERGERGVNFQASPTVYPYSVPT